MSTSSGVAPGGRGRRLDEVRARPSRRTGTCGRGERQSGAPAGNISPIQRGTCTFALKATHAYNAGAAGVVIYNNLPGLVHGTLSADFTLDIPVTSIAQDVGQQLAATTGLVLRLKTETNRGETVSHNIIAESPGGAPANVVMVGAHLDSTDEGPGINDNGSGAAALLEIAVQMSRVTPWNKVRFALWGAHENGLVGSMHYVNTLGPTDLASIALYLDAHMIGSPNHVFFVLDGDDSDGVGTGPGPTGSAAIERTFLRYFAGIGVPTKGVDLTARSDYGPFVAVGVPSGGVFGGAEGLKSAEEASLWGGTPGEQYDPCYHLACDTFANVSLQALSVNADALAYAVLQYAMSTKDVNGLKGRGDFNRLPVLPGGGPLTQ